MKRRAPARAQRGAVCWRTRQRINGAFRRQPLRILGRRGLAAAILSRVIAGRVFASACLLKNCCGTSLATINAARDALAQAAKAMAVFALYLRVLTAALQRHQDIRGGFAPLRLTRCGCPLFRAIRRIGRILPTYHVNAAQRFFLLRCGVSAAKRAWARDVYNARIALRRRAFIATQTLSLRVRKIRRHRACASDALYKQAEHAQWRTATRFLRILTRGVMSAGMFEDRWRLQRFQALSPCVHRCALLCWNYGAPVVNLLVGVTASRPWRWRLAPCL